jgi:hypothetical protein
MKTTLKQHQVKTKRPVKDGATPRMPHERDESDDSQESAPRRDIKQAYDDLMNGQVDTDLRETRGVDAVVNKPPGPSPVNPNDVASDKKK